MRHLCPLCGTTLLVSGGGINRSVPGLIIGFSALSILILVLLSVFSR